MERELECLLCLSTLGGGGDKSVIGGGVGVQLALTLLSRWLNIGDLERRLKNNATTTTSTEIGGVKKEVKVGRKRKRKRPQSGIDGGGTGGGGDFHLCPKCDDVMKNFRDLYCEAEVIRLRLHHCVERIQGILQQSEMSSTSSPSTTCGGGKGGISESWRHQVLSKCKSQLGSLPPLLKLRKIVSPPPPLLKQRKLEPRPLLKLRKIDSPPPPLLKPRKIEPPPSPPIQEPTSVMNPTTATVTATSSSIPSRGRPSKAIFKYQSIGPNLLKCLTCGLTLPTGSRGSHTQKHKGDKHFKCSLCGSTFFSFSNASDHLARKHRGLLFATCKKKDESGPDFKDRLNAFLEAVIKKHEKPDGTPYWTCEYCDLVRSTKSSAVIHLWQTHFIKVSVKLGGKKKRGGVPKVEPSVQNLETYLTKVFVELKSAKNEPVPPPLPLSSKEEISTSVATLGGPPTPAVLPTSTAINGVAIGGKNNSTFPPKLNKHVVKYISTSATSQQNNRRIKCTLCSSRFTLYTTACSHLASTHRASIFRCCKDAFQSSQEFAAAVDTVLDECMATGGGSKRMKDLSCKFCGYQRLSNCRIRMTIHLAKNHFQLVASELSGNKAVVAQDGKTVLESLLERRSTSKRVHRRQRPEAKITAAVKAAVKRIKKNRVRRRPPRNPKKTKARVPVAKEVEVTTTSTAPDEPAYRCLHCDMTFATESSLVAHTLNLHAEKLFATSQRSHVDSGKFKEVVHQAFNDHSKKGRCTLCSSRLPEGGGSGVTHFVEEHFDKIASHIVSLQNNGGVTPPNDVEDQVMRYSCGHCGLEVDTLDTHHLHQVTSHRKETLAKSLPQISTMTESQLTKLLGAAFAPCLSTTAQLPGLEEDVDIEEGSTYCLLCSQSFSYGLRANVEDHLLVHHMKDVIENMRETLAATGQ